MRSCFVHTGLMSSILVLGGTAWLGHELATHALKQGHQVWCLARGDSGNVPQGATHVRSDRSHFAAYADLRAMHFDKAIEVSWQPRWVNEAVSTLNAQIDHWTHISSVSVYAQHDGALHDESVPLHPPLDVHALAHGEDYSRAKVTCEAILDAKAPGRVLHVRAGVIAGPGDPTDRFGYWPSRFALAQDGPVLVPHTPQAATQNIDIRDLCAWVHDASTRGLTGPVNAVGPTRTFREMITVAQEAAGYQGDTVTATGSWLKERAVSEWSGPRSLPWWIDGDHKYPAIGRHDNTRYRETGGTNRDYRALMVDVCEDERSRGLERPRRAGLTRDEEMELIGELLT